MSVSYTKNVCQSQSNMQPFFLYIQVINNMFLLFPTAILVIIDNPSNCQHFLSFLKCFRPLSKCVSHNRIGCLSDTKKGAYQ